MSPGSVCLGPPSAHHHFLDGILVSSKQQSVREEKEPWSTGMMSTVSKKTEQSSTSTILYQPYMQHQGSPHLQETPAMFLAPQVGAALGFAISCTSDGGCSHGRVPELVASTLALAGRVSCQCHTATPATGAWDSVGTQEQNHCRGLYGLV